MKQSPRDRKQVEAEKETRLSGINEQRWQWIKQVYSAALERDPNLRTSFLEQACAEDDSLRRAVESLLMNQPSIVRSAESIEINAVARAPARDQDHALPARLVGCTVAHFRVVEKIGQGGMGEVYRARDEHLDREVAIKVLPSGTLSDESSRKRFRKEALALSRLNHPNIATIHDFDTQDGLDFLVMEYIPGTTLCEKLSPRPLPEKEVIALGTQLAEGLSAAHEHGVIHRDVKPGNLRLTVDGRLKILDFGLAKFRNPVTSVATTWSLSETHGMAGTPLYMAPEQFLGGEIDARTDIHAAGCILYEMATGQRPFAALDRSRLAAAIVHKSPLPPTLLNPDLSPELERIIGKCLEKEPGDRYQSAKELAIDLKRLERQSASGSSMAEFSMGPFMRRVRLHRRNLAMTGALVLVLAIVAASVWRGFVHKAQQPPVPVSIAVLPFADRSSDHSQEYFSNGLAEEILNSLAKVPGLKVAARTSAFQFKGENEDLQVIRAKLNVENVLEGSVQREGARVRVTAQLFKASDGFQLWSEAFERDLEDIFDVQEDIAQAVTTALQIRLLAGAAPATPPRSRITPEVYQDFLQARYFGRMGDRESAQKALDCINRAIQSDARYAAAYALRAYLTLSSGSMAWLDYPETVEKSRRDIEKAMELDPNLPDAYRVLSLIQSAVEANCRTAEITLGRALELAPGDAENLGQRGLISMCLGRQEEAVQLLNQTIALDPLQPGRYLRLAQNLRDLGRYADSEAALEKALDLNPHNIWIHETRGELYLLQGRAQEALQEMEKEPAGSLHDLGMAIAYKALGRDQESKAVLGKMISDCANHCAYQIAQAYAYRGEVDQALDWLERARRQNDGGLLLIKTDLLLKSLRSDPRYTKLLKSLNLSD